MSPRQTKRADGRYIVNVTVDEPDGTKRRVYFYGRTQSEAKHKAEAARERVAQGAPVRDATRSVSDWLAEWRETFLQASDRAGSTKSLYAGLTLRHVEPVIGRTPLGQVRPSDVTRVLLAMKRGGSAASTRRNAYAALRSAFDEAVADGLLALNPVPRPPHHREHDDPPLSRALPLTPHARTRATGSRPWPTMQPTALAARTLDGPRR